MLQMSDKKECVTEIIAPTKKTVLNPLAEIYNNTNTCSSQKQNVFLLEYIIYELGTSETFPLSEWTNIRVYNMTILLAAILYGEQAGKARTPR
jgi:hypothetical protein